MSVRKPIRGVVPRSHQCHVKVLCSLFCSWQFQADQKIFVGAWMSFHSLVQFVLEVGLVLMVLVASQIIIESLRRVLAKVLQPSAELSELTENLFAASHVC